MYAPAKSEEFIGETGIIEFGQAQAIDAANSGFTATPDPAYVIPVATPWYQTVVGATVPVSDSVRKKIGLDGPDISDSMVFENTDFFAELSMFVTDRDPEAREVVRGLTNAKMGSAAQVEAAETLAEVALENLSQSMNNYVEQVFDGLKVTESDRFDSMNEWATGNWSPVLTIAGSEHEYGSIRQVALRLDHAAGMAALETDLASLPLPLARQMSFAMSMLADIAGKITGPDLMEFGGYGYAYNEEMIEGLDQSVLNTLIAADDAKATLDEAVRNDEIDVDHFECFGGYDDWQDELLVAIGQRKEAQQQWIGTYSREVGVSATCEAILSELKQWGEQQNPLYGHPLVSALQRCCKALFRHLDTDAYDAAPSYVEQGSDFGCLGLFSAIGYGFDFEESIYISQHEYAMQESETSSTLLKLGTHTDCILNNMNLGELLTIYLVLNAE